ncbi:MAG: dTMP kinase [Sulfolobales archaeon]
MIEVPLHPVTEATIAKVCGRLITYDGLISPLGDIDATTGRLKNTFTIKNRIVAVKGFTGSTVGPYIIYSLKKRGLAPKALIVEQVDVNAVTSAVISDIPLFKVDKISDIEKLNEEGSALVCIESGKLKPRGALIAIEGVDGAGKTTVSKHLLEIFRKCGFRAIYTYEPYYDSIRKIFENKSMDLTPESEALLLVADRYSHISKVVKRELERGGIVILDRYKYSTIAYQGALGLPLEWLREVQKYLPDPDVAVYLDINPVEGLKRKLKSKERTLTYFENVERIEKAREIYLDMASKGELTLVDASLELPIVVEKVIEVVNGKLGLEIRECSS